MSGEGPDPRRWKALAVCLVAGFMTLLDVSIVNVALPSIQSGLQAPASDLQWVVSGYALTFGLVLVPAGRLGDATGRRTVFIAGVAVFGAASLACGLAPNSGFLVAARLVQGVGGGLINPQVSGLIQEMFRGRERGRAFGMLGATIGLSTAVGPIVGGTIISALGPASGWRWIFAVNLPVAVGAVVLARRWVPLRERSGRERPDYDPLGVVLLGGAVLALLLPLVESSQGFGVGLVTGLVAVGAALVGLFVLWERRYATTGRSPLVDLSLFTRPGYASGATVATVYFSGFTGVLFVLSVYLQQSLGYSALEAGAAVTPFAAGSAVTAAIGGRLVERWGRSLVTVGLVTVAVGFVVTDVVLGAAAGAGHVGWRLAPSLLVAGLGSGLVISPNITLTLAEVPVERAGTAGGVLTTGQRIGTATGIAVLGAVFFGAASSGDPTGGAVWALRVATLSVLLSLLASGLDLRARRRRRRSAGPERGAEPAQG